MIGGLAGWEESVSLFTSGAGTITQSEPFDSIRVGA